MRIAVWKTGHEIADTVAEAVYEGLSKNRECSLFHTNSLRGVEETDCGIGYGILRGMDSVFRSYDTAGKPWFNIDKGYFKPGHYDGYYRVSLGGTQQTTGLEKLQPEYDRLDALGIAIEYKTVKNGYTLVCPPTDSVFGFFGRTHLVVPNKSKLLIREKGCSRPIGNDLLFSESVVTFNSSVGWEALRQGIPVASDKNHSIVGAYQKMLMDRGIPQSVDSRRELFGIMAGLQLRLDEMRQGLLWPLMQRLMSISGTTLVKQ